MKKYLFDLDIQARTSLMTKILMNGTKDDDKPYRDFLEMLRGIDILDFFSILCYQFYASAYEMLPIFFKDISRDAIRKSIARKNIFDIDSSTVKKYFIPFYSICTLTDEGNTYVQQLYAKYGFTAKDPLPRTEHIFHAAMNSLMSIVWLTLTDSMEVSGEGGRPVFPYNQSNLEIIYSPEYICNITYQKNEIIKPDCFFEYMIPPFAYKMNFALEFDAMTETVQRLISKVNKYVLMDLYKEMPTENHFTPCFDVNAWTLNIVLCYHNPDISKVKPAHLLQKNIKMLSDNLASIDFDVFYNLDQDALPADAKKCLDCWSSYISADDTKEDIISYFNDRTEENLFSFIDYPEMNALYEIHREDAWKRHAAMCKSYVDKMKEALKSSSYPVFNYSNKEINEMLHGLCVWGICLYQLPEVLPFVERGGGLFLPFLSEKTGYSFIERVSFGGDNVLCLRNALGRRGGGDPWNIYAFFEDIMDIGGWIRAIEYDIMTNEHPNPEYPTLYLLYDREDQIEDFRNITGLQPNERFQFVKRSFFNKEIKKITKSI